MVLVRKTTLVGLVALFLVGAVAAAIYKWERAVRSPTPDEYRVYGALLKRLAKDNKWRLNGVALSSTTLPLIDQRPESWVPKELQPDKMDPPPSAVDFCGDLCGREFVRRNLVEWVLNSTAQSSVGFPIVAPSKEISAEIPPKYHVVGVTRVGFNMWHTRAIVSYSADSNDDSSEPPVMCLESGEAYLEKKNGVWQVDHWDAVCL